MIHTVISSCAAIVVGIIICVVILFLILKIQAERRLGNDNDNDDGDERWNEPYEFSDDVQYLLGKSSRDLYSLAYL
jgi:hypothetical protein